MALDLGADVEQQIDLLDRRIADDHPLHDAPEPPGALATGRALAAALVHVEFRQAGDRTDDVGRPVHDDDGGGAETAALRSQAVEIHEDGVADLLRQQRRRRTAGDHGEEIVPAATHAVAVPVAHLAQRYPHHLFHVARLLDVPGDAEELGAGVVHAAGSDEPGAPAADRTRAGLGKNV